MSRIARRALWGAAAGVVGTVAMTTLMKPGLAGELPPRWRPAEWVPRRIVRWMERAAGTPRALPAPHETAAATLAHLGYGATMGAVYGVLRGDAATLPAPRAGAAFGLAVWALGYEGWLPALGVQRATTDLPPTKWPIPIANHLVYGVVTALAYDRMRPPAARPRA